MPNIVEMTMNIQLATTGSAGIRFMSEPAISKAYPVASKMKTVIHPPRHRSLSVVISSNQNFDAGKGRDYPIPVFQRSDGHVSEVDHRIFGFHYLIPIFNDTFCEIRRPITVRFHVLMFEMSIGDQVKIHSITHHAEMALHLQKHRTAL